ncbi:uncharacterized protein ASCRUDRAFT_68621 [Ascoidea rubescens DSM 1968]|uniref:L domain-like protein n=1 Tax=Ascoidea rubescens DSM 1968 TaxID=1344418 RepID=A0A1D2VMF4_9ASCO|nr:hypothetical protein ASCRUDRAFT_68621 [Ascoidea rubescens DSM 1968]ODV62796.1 hypothetical protein ASCRUDRAFT_68621 [Ascoidea rubescens DSM 1968]
MREILPISNKIEVLKITGGSLSQLRRLDLSKNLLISLQIKRDTLIHLRILTLNSNKLEKIDFVNPESNEIYVFPRLKILNFDGNKLKDAKWLRYLSPAIEELIISHFETEQESDLSSQKIDDN